MSQLAIAERANGSCASKGYSWFRCTSPIYFVGCCKNGTSPCDNGCKDNELDPQEVASCESIPTTFNFNTNEKIHVTNYDHQLRQTHKQVQEQPLRSQPQRVSHR